MKPIQDAIYLAALLWDTPEGKDNQLVKNTLSNAGLPAGYLEELLTASRRIANGGVSRDSSHKWVRSVFDRMLQNGETREANWHPISRLSLNRELFPKPSQGDEEDAERLLWEPFQKEAGNLKQDNIALLAETVLALLEKYTAFLPHPASIYPEVSFHSFTKSLAGIAVCLHRYLAARGKDGAGFELEENEEPFVLIGGDLSGIQPFIYNIISKYAAKNLKGRSFYLQLLGDSVLYQLLQELGLYQSNVIYASGGSFFALAPNVEEITNAFDENRPDAFTNRINRKLYLAHRAALSLIIDYRPVALRDIYNNQLADVKSNLATDQLDWKKKQKLHRVIAENYGQFFGRDLDIGGLQARDFLTGEELDKEEARKAYYIDEETNNLLRVETEADLEKGPVISSRTREQIELGKNLKNLDYWIIADEPIPGIPPDFIYNPCDIGVYNYLIPREKLSPSKFQGHACRIYKINSLEGFIAPEAFGSGHQFGFLFYGGNKYPVDEFGEQKYFSELAGSREELKAHRNLETDPDQEESGFKRLGVLRMDVDGLGHIFRRGFTQEPMTFALYSTLSSSIDFFFKGFLNTLWEENEDFREFTQIIYSGGDDLFIVGRWDLLIRFAKEIKEQFQEWVGHNPLISLSGGMAIVTHKFPIMRAAELAGEAEKAAKGHAGVLRTIGPEGEQENILVEKNAFSLLNLPLRWEAFEGQQANVLWANEFAVAEELKDRILELYEREDAAPKGFIQKIKSWYLMSQDETGRGKNFRWQWQIAYDFTRTIDRLKYHKSGGGKASMLDFLEEVKQSTIANSYKGAPLHSKYSFFELLNLAARWAELELRTLQQ